MRVEEVFVRKFRHVAAQKFGIVGHHRTVEVVVRIALVEVLRKTGVEHRVHALFQQARHVPMHDLRRVTGRVRRDGELPRLIDAAVGHVREHDLEPQRAEDAGPQRQQFIHAKRQRQADAPAPRFAAAHGKKRLALVFVEVGQFLLGLFAARAALAAVAGDEAAAVGKGVDRQFAAVLAALAHRRPRGVGKFRQFFGGEYGGFFQPHGAQRRAVSAHQTGDVRPDDVAPQFALEGAQDGVVVEGAALYHHVLPQFVGGTGADDLVDGVFDHADGEPGGDVLHRGAVALRLLDRGVHKHRAAAAKVDRRAGKEAPAGEFLHAHVHGLGKRLDERAAARGTGLVEHDAVDRPVAYAEALDVLPADVEYEVHVRAEVARGHEVGDRLHHADVHMEGVADEILAVTGHGAAENGHAALRAAVDRAQFAAHDLHGIAIVGGVVGIQKFFVFGNERQLGGGAAAVDAQIRPAAIGGKFRARYGSAGVARGKGGVLRFVLKQRRQRLRPGNDLGRGQRFAQLSKRKGLRRARGEHGRASRHGKAPPLGEHRVLLGEFQGFAEALPKPLAVVQGPAEKQHLALNPAPLRKARDGLVDDGLKDAHGHVFLARALIEQRLYVRLGKHAAARGDGVNARGMLAEAVEFGHVYVQERGHLVDERARTAGAAAVHALVHAAGRAVEKDDLGVFAAQFDNHIGVRRQRAHQFADHKDLLLKGQARGLGKSDARRTGDRRAQKAVRDQRLKIRKHLEYLLPRLRIVALITLIEDISALHQRQFYRRGADIDPQRTDGLLLCLFHAKSRLCAGMAGKK